MRIENIDVVVLGTPHKPILTTSHLGAIDHRIYLNSDWQIPADHIGYRNASNQTAKLREVQRYRCFRGHQEILKDARSDIILVLEDDAVPNTNRWIEIIESAAHLLRGFEVISLHLRRIRSISERFTHRDNDYVTLASTEPAKEDVRTWPVPPKGPLKWGTGSLAYLTTRSHAIKISTCRDYCMPYDLFLINQSQCCILLNSCFNHDRRHGSLLENL